MTGPDVWQPPDNWSGRAAPMTPGSLAGWLVAGIALVLVVVGTIAVGLPHRTSRHLPRTFAEIQAAEGEHITVETGTTSDNGRYAIEVSVRTDGGGYCDFLRVTAAGGGFGAGGGGCGPGAPMSYSYGDDGIVHGITDGRIATVEVLSAAAPVTVPTKPLPAQFKGHRHFVAMLPGGIRPTSVVGRAADGSVVARQQAHGR